jgi:hypothetical protein
VQTLEANAPTIEEKVPAGHEVHAEALKNVPAGQGMQSDVMVLVLATSPKARTLLVWGQPESSTP